MIIFFDAELDRPNPDQGVQYTAPGSNAVLLDIKPGLFSDGFE